MSRAHALLTLLASVVLSAQQALLVAGEDSCPAGSNAASCRNSAVASSRTVPAPAPAPQADLITQEVEELEAIVKLSSEKIVLLKELQAAVMSGHNLSLPASHAQALREKVPLLSDLAADSEAGPTATSEDYLISKAVISQEEPLVVIKFLPLRNPRSSSSSSSASTQTNMPSALLVAVQADSQVRLFTPSGDLVLTFSAGHEFQVTHLAVSPSHDEYLFATGDSGGVIRVHKVMVRQRRLQKHQKQVRRNSTEDKVSQYLSSSLNVTAQLQRQMQVPMGSDGEAPRMTSLAMASQSGNKFFVAGDAEGKVSVFTKNGTFRAKIDVSAVPGTSVESLDSQLSSLLFRAGPEWGFIELDKMKAKHLDCQYFEGPVTSAVIDSQQSSRVLVADEDGSIWVLNVKNKNDCRVEFKFAKGATHTPIYLASVRGFVIGLEHGEGAGDLASVVALNMSQASERNELGQGPSSVVWRRSRPAVRAWAVHKRYQQGDLIACLSEDGHEIEIMELLMQVYKEPSSMSDSFGNFKLPVIAIAVVLVLGYQYMKGKGKFGKSGGLGGKKLDFNSDEFASALKSKRKLGGLGGLKSKKFS